MKIRGFSINILGVLTAFMLALFSTSATAGVIWRAGITAFSGDDSNTIYFAAADDATDGFENGYESRAIMAGKLVAYFYHPEWGVDTAYFWSEGKDTLLPKDWEFYVKSNYTAVNMNWTVAETPQTVELYLVDEYTGTVVDMKNALSYAYASSSSVPRKFTIRARGYLEEGAGISPAPPDAAPPETFITTVLPAFTGSSTVTVEYGGTDDVTPADALEFSYSIDAVAWSGWTNDKSASLAGLSDGAHAFSVKAKDAAGNVDPTPSEIRFSVDRTAPLLKVNAPNPSTLSPPNRRMRDVVISGNAADGGAGLAGVDYALTDEYGEFASSGSVAVSNGGFSFTLSLRAWVRRNDRDGRVYTITVIAADNAGNGKSESVTVTVPNR
ncbi:MAG TPA: hypothetical protein VFF54_05000 [Thermodesulfobacteriota bacterium]|nr:hypothetical protein [Thermodesulfobacteriota bacterium]